MRRCKKLRQFSRPIRFTFQSEALPKIVEAIIPWPPKIARNKQAQEDAEVDEARMAIFGKPPPGYEDPALLELGAIPETDPDRSAKLR